MKTVCCVVCTCRSKTSTTTARNSRGRR